MAEHISQIHLGTPNRSIIVLYDSEKGEVTGIVAQGLDERGRPYQQQFEIVPGEIKRGVEVKRIAVEAGVNNR